MDDLMVAMKARKLAGEMAAMTVASWVDESVDESAAQKAASLGFYWVVKLVVVWVDDWVVL